MAGVAQTGSRCFSTSATAVSQAPLASMSGPATSTGLAAACSRPARREIAPASGAVRAAIERTVAFSAMSPSASSAQSSIGIDTNAGPRGGSIAWWIARPIAYGTSCARAGSCAHFTYGCGPIVESRLVRLASIAIWARACWPAVITSGDLLACALKMPPTALPTPGAVCRFT